MEKHIDRLDMGLTFAAVTSSVWAHLLADPIQALTFIFSSVYLLLKITREFLLILEMRAKPKHRAADE